MHTWHWPFWTAMLGLGSLACDGSALTTPEAVAGTFVLTSVDGCAVMEPVPPCAGTAGPVATRGQMDLGTDRRVSRVVTYARLEDPAAEQTKAEGTYAVRDGELLFSLHEDGTSPGSVWKVAGHLQGDRLTLRYPNGADGTVVETFERLAAD